MKVSIELDTSDTKDLEALERLFGKQRIDIMPSQQVRDEMIHKAVKDAKELLKAEPVKAPKKEVKAVKPVIVPKKENRPAPKPAPKPQPKVKAKSDVKTVAERGKAMTTVSEQLGSAVGDRAKLTRKEKAQVAAKARWDKHKKLQAEGGASSPKSSPAAAKPKPKPAPVKKPPMREAKPQDFSRAEEQEEKFEEQSGEHMGIPVEFHPTRDFPDGRELLEGTFKTPEPEGEDHERSVAEIARELGGLPSSEDGAVL